MQIKLPLVLDGSTGTQLQKRGFNGETTAEEWSLAHPEAVEDFQRRYIDAGSDVIYTPTFGANSAMLESHKVFGRVRELNLGLAAISKRTAGDRAYVAGDISTRWATRPLRICLIYTASRQRRLRKRALTCL